MFDQEQDFQCPGGPPAVLGVKLTSFDELDVSEAMDAWKMQFTAVDLSELSEAEMRRLVKAQEKLPKAQLGRVGGKLFAYAMDPETGPRHVRLCVENPVSLPDGSMFETRLFWPR